MFKDNFSSSIDFNKLIATEECFQKDIKETYPVCYLISLYLGNNFTKHKKEVNTNQEIKLNQDSRSNKKGFSFVSISSKVIYKTLGRSLLTKLKEDHLFYKVFEVDNRYKFNKKGTEGLNKEDTFTKAYKLYDHFIFKLLIHKLILSDNKIYCYSKFMKQKHYLVKGFSFNNRKEILESKIITRKEFDLNKDKYLNYYNSLVEMKPKEKTFSNVKTKSNKIDYFTKPNIDTKYVLSVVEDISLEDAYKLSSYEALEYIRMTMKAKTNESNSKKSLYTRHESGRLVGIGIDNISVNFQVLPKWQREIFFRGKFEYDMSNAVITLFLNLYQYLGGERGLKSVYDYMNNKNKYRQALIDLGFSKSLAKQYFITILYGKDLSNNIEESYRNTDWMQEVTKEHFFKALEIPFIKKLLDELDYLKDFLVSHYKKVATISGNKNSKYCKYTIRNANNCYKTFTKFDLEKNKGKVLAHLFFGLESKIMDFIKDNFETNLLIYDGFISEEDIDTEYLELLIENELGYKVKFSKRLIGYNNEDKK